MRQVSTKLILATSKLTFLNKIDSCQESLAIQTMKVTNDY